MLSGPDLCQNLNRGKYITMNENPQTIADVEAIAAKMGLTIPAEDYAQAYALAELRREQLESANEVTKVGLVDRFNIFYPRFIKSLHALGDLFIVFTHSMLIAFGVPIVLALSLIVEQQRITGGVKLFEANNALASFAATVLVLVNLILELLVSWRQHQVGWKEPPRYEFSFRLVAIRLRYLFGQSVDWQPNAKSPAHVFRLLLRLLTVTILALALAGSMQLVIERNGGDWYAAIEQIAIHSTLLELFTWIGGLLFAFTFVRIAQVLSSFVAEKVVEVAAIMQSNVEDKPSAIAETTGLTAAMYIFGKLKESQRQRRSMASAANIPYLENTINVAGVPNTVPNGSEQHIDLINVAGVPNRSEQIAPAIQKALEWLKENDPDGDLSVRVAANRAGISVTTMHNAKKLIGK